MLTARGLSKSLALFLILPGNPLLSHSSVCLIFNKCSLSSWRNSALILNLLRIFLIVNGSWILSNAFSLSVDTLTWFFFFFSLYGRLHSLMFSAYFPSALHVWTKSHLVVIFFNSVIEISLRMSFWEFSHLYPQETVVYSCFLAMSLSDFGTGLILASQNELANVPFSSIVWKRV